MNWAKKIGKTILKGIFLVVGFVAVYFLAAVSSQYITTNNDYVEPMDGTEIFIVSNGVHADICLPLDMNRRYWIDMFQAKDFTTLTNQPQYISFGWGDKGFFLDTPTWDDLTVGTALKAACLPSNTAMHVSYLEEKPKLSERIKSFRVGEEALERMEAYILSYIKLKNNLPQLIDCCRYPNVHDNFYEANGSYHMFRTCNVWTNQVIKEAGVKTSIWTPFDAAILYQFEE